MEPVQYLRLARRRWPVIAAAVVVAAAASWVTTPAAPEVSGSVRFYRASHTLINAPDVPKRVDVDLTAVFVRTGEVPKRVAEKVKFPGLPAVLASRVQVVPDPEVGTLVITINDDDPKRAVQLADAFASEVLAYLRETAERRRQEAMKATIAQLDGLSAKTAKVEAEVTSQPKDRLLKAQRDAFVSQYRVAYEQFQLLSSETSAKPSLITLETAAALPVVDSVGFRAPTTRRARVLSAAGLGLLLGAALALIVERLDSRIRTRDAAERAFQRPVIADVPRLSRALRRTDTVIVRARPESAAAEAYRSLRSALVMLPRTPLDPAVAGDRADPHPMQVVLVTSPGGGEGKTSTTANLAACLAETGKSVLVLNCDFRRPRVHRYLDVPDGHGIAELITSDRSEDLRHIVRPTAVPGVRLALSGAAPTHPAALLAHAGSIIREARRLADIVLIDTAPMLVANDTVDLLPHVDGVLLVCRSGRTNVERASRTSELLARVGTPVIGVGLIGTRSSAGSFGGYVRYRLPHIRVSDAAMSAVGRATTEADTAHRGASRHSSRES